MSDYARQCLLERDTTDGRESIVSFIPERYAQKGRVLRLRGDDGTWTDGWQVVAVYARVEVKEAHERARDWTRQRKASDI
jgi:hypothetical protein